MALGGLPLGGTRLVQGGTNGGHDLSSGTPSVHVGGELGGGQAEGGSADAAGHHASGGSQPTGGDRLGGGVVAPTGGDMVGGAAMPLDECALGLDNCDVNATCTDTSDSFECECNGGFEGDGVTCTDINECQTGNGGCAHVCSNEVGGFTCACRPGFYSEDDGVNCAPSPISPALSRPLPASAIQPTKPLTMSAHGMIVG